MNCIIIDDETTSRTILRKLCSNMDNVDVVEEFPNAIEGIKYLNGNEIDFVFLDVLMPDFSGFDFIQTLKDPPKIILTTSDKNFAIQAFEYDCIVDYVVKPLTLDRLVKAVKKVETFQTNSKTEKTTVKDDNVSDNDLYVNIDRRLIKIDIPSIYLVQAKGDYVHIKTEEKNYIVHSTLKKVEDKLPDSLFLKVHRSYIINIKKIVDIENNSVLIKRDVIPVSRSSRPELMRRLNLL